MNSDQRYQVICVSGWCDWHDLKESERFGLAVRCAIEERYDGVVAVFSGGSLSHHFADNGKAPEYAFKTYNAFLEQIDLRVVQLWERGEHRAVIDMLPMYADKCWGEGKMHDTAMLYGTPAVEIIDARIEQFDRHTEAPRKVFDTISDNAANAGILLGGIKTLPRKVDLPGVNALKQVKWCWQGRSPGLLRLRQAMCLTPTLDG